MAAQTAKDAFCSLTQVATQSLYCPSLQHEEAFRVLHGPAQSCTDDSKETPPPPCLYKLRQCPKLMRSLRLL